MQKLTFKNLSINYLEHLDTLGELLSQAPLKNPEGKLFDKEWTIELITKGAAMGAFDGKELVACVIGESILCNGFLIWFVAVKPELQGKGIGKQLMTEFERCLRLRDKKEWIFLNSTPNSDDFYTSIGYITSPSNVKEQLKYL